MKTLRQSTRLVRTRNIAGKPARIDALEGRRLLASVVSGLVDSGFGSSFTGGTAMSFAPDGRLLALSQGGTVRVIESNGTTSTALSLTVDTFSERGLLGIALDPAFTSNNYVYLYYTKPAASGQPLVNRVSRFTMSGNTISPASEQTILTLDPLSAGNHNGGAIHFGPDNKLYVAVGDNNVASNAQSLSTRHGKMLRINTDGTIPADNPTAFAGLTGTTSGVNRAIWAVGLRNPFTFAFDPGQPGRMHINDVGQNTWEEVNVGGAGRNFGWPATEGDFNQASFPNFTRPLYYFGHSAPSNTQGFSIAGGAFYRSTAAKQFPQQFQGKYFFGEYVNDWINYIDPAAPPAGHSTASVFATGASGIVDIQMGPDGSLYYLQREGTAGVRRISVNSSLAPSILEQPQNQSVSVGNSATFTVNAAGSAGTLAYQWQRNGVNISGANAATYTRTNVQTADNGAAFRVIVTNTAGTAISNAATLTVTAANTAPVPTITAPALNTIYRGGQTFNFSGSATDAQDGTLAASKLSWRIDFHHDTHTHPFYPETSGITGGSFTIPTTGETATNVFYRVILTATDSAGATTTVTRDIQPELSVIKLRTSGVPDGVSGWLRLDGQPIAAPDNVSVVGIVRNIEAIELTFGGQTYDFVSWSDGGSRAHDIITPVDDTTYTAVFKDVTAPNVRAPALFTRERRSASAPPHELTFTFDEDAFGTADALTLVNTTTNQTVPTSSILATRFGKRIFFSFPGFANGVLPDGNYRATLDDADVADAAGNTLAGGDAIVNFRVLAGDANNDALVNFADLVILSQNYNQSGKTFSQGNFDYSTDGLVNFSDLVILAQRYNQSLPAVPAPVSTASRPSRSASVLGDDGTRELLA